VTTLGPVPKIPCCTKKLVKGEVEQLIVRMARENRDWGYDRIVGALANLGYAISDQTVGNILRRHAQDNSASVAMS
jgi:hypothetical protein